MSENKKIVRPNEVSTELHHKMVELNCVAKVIKGGRTFTFAAIVVVGDGNGLVGQGLGKAREVTESIDKGKEDAMKNLVRVPVRNGSIPYEQYAKYGAAKVLLRPASKGTGVIAGGAMRAVLESAGVIDVVCKSLGSSNAHNVIKATIRALSLMRDPIAVSKQRGIKLDRVFNG